MPTDTVPVVGIGASAGGLQALEALFRLLPADSGLAFVVVTHLARGRESALAEIIARFTTMRVNEATDGLAITANHVYVSQSTHVLTISHGKLQLTLRTSDSQLKPIDVFFSSLAEDCGELAVGIILSGTGSDGTLGMKAIRERGGFTMAQGSDGSAPQYNDMPRTAVVAGVVDIEVPVEDMADCLVNFMHSAQRIIENFGEGGQGFVDAAANIPRPKLELIYALLSDRIGHDFSGYKEKTFSRRVARRMQILQINSIDNYIDKLNDSDELSLLFRDLLIGVTSFFRDTDAFDALAKTVVPLLFKERTAHDVIRVWVPACATGEEAFSIAILLREYLDTLSQPPKLQIFATDIDDRALSLARAGRYPSALLSHVSPDRLERFFVGDGHSYSIAKEIRDMCVFSSHSVLRDPPFSRIDLVSCRNLLIYLGAKFQEQVIPIFHFALRPMGYLFLGTSENVSRHGDLFNVLDKRQRIFQRREDSHRRIYIPSLHSIPPIRKTEFLGDIESGTLSLRRAIETRIIDKFAPAHVVVNSAGDALYYSSRTGRYLEAAVGAPSRQLLTMCRSGLRLELRDALKEAFDTKRMVIRENICIDGEDRLQFINLTIEPLGDSATHPLYLLVFQDICQQSPTMGKTINEDSSAAEHYEKELRDIRERLQSTVEEYETGVEELKSSNEELQSINEELQSANEELETSKEELQSINEELQTVNGELSGKVDELDRSNNDLRNIFESTQIGTVFLDQKLLIRSFTPAINSVFNLIASDRGRPLTDIVSNIDNPNLSVEIKNVLASGNAFEKNVQSITESKYYHMRLLPYRNTHQVIEGVLVTFFDITSLTAAERQQRTLIDELNHRVRNMLTIVNAVAQQTMRHSASKEVFAEAFMGRIRGMSTAFALVSRENWGAVQLQEVIRSHLAPYQMEDSDRINVSGVAVLCTPNAALAIGMVIHELATNAVKYGALMSQDGVLTIDWLIEQNERPLLRLRWLENKQDPIGMFVKKGFGMKLVERELVQALNASIEFQFNPNGLLLCATIPLNKNSLYLS